MPGKKHGKQIPPNGGASVSKKIPISISDKIQIVMAIFAFLSLIGVLLTLKEMQAERNAAYNPTILMHRTLVFHGTPTVKKSGLHRCQIH